MIGLMLAAVAIYSPPVTLPEATLGRPLVVAAEAHPSRDIVLLRNENTGELMMALMLRENIGPRTQAMMIEGDGVYRIQEPGGRSYFGLLRGTRMEGTWECKCVGTGGIPGICPQLTDCPPVDCKNDSTTGHANCTWVKVIPPS
jgi:hypothetical protein